MNETTENALKKLWKYMEETEMYILHFHQSDKGG